MPVIRPDDTTPVQMFPGILSRPMVNKQHGAANLTVNELTLAPGATFPLHEHPTHEEGMYLLEGRLELTLGGEIFHLMPGTGAVAPQGVFHSISNKGNTAARMLAIFPTLTPVRNFKDQPK